jgi:uncharacterized phage protein (TIGR02218 family)
MSAFLEHLRGGTTFVCRCWRVARRDGTVFGFTDHDLNLTFLDTTFRAGTGLSARAVQQTTGLAVDNSEAAGALSDTAVTEADLLNGKFDGAEVTVWRVVWTDPEVREVEFRGTLGEISRSGGAFRAELRGLTEALNQPQGRAIQRTCSAVLGDAGCGFDLDQPGYAATLPVEAVAGGRVLSFTGLAGFDDRWFERGRLQVLSGAAAGAVGVVKNDRLTGMVRTVELWQGIGALEPGDLLRIDAGCDRQSDTCRLKFGNFLNFRGFPHVPGEDWLTSYPVPAGRNDGGSLYS